MDAFGTGGLVFTGAGAGIVLGYVDRETDERDAQGNLLTERHALVARFASVDEVAATDLAGSPSEVGDDGLGVPAEPSHEGDTGSVDNPATADDGTAPFTPSTPEAPQGKSTPAESDADREARQDQELAQLSAEERDRQSPGAGPEAAPSASSSATNDAATAGGTDPAGSVTSPPATPADQTTVARAPGETTPPVGGTHEDEEA